jgi:predicted RNA methylase
VLQLTHSTLKPALARVLHVTSVANCLQVDSMYDEFSGRSVIDIGCGTVRKSYPIQCGACKRMIS